jgi:hypothetical protein
LPETAALPGKVTDAADSGKTIRVLFYIKIFTLKTLLTILRTA